MKTPDTKPTPIQSARQAEHGGVGNLLTGMSVLVNPDYHELNAKKQRLLHAVLCAYAKHHLGRDEIGWEQLSDILLNAICEEIGDKEYVKWNESL